MNGIFKNSFDCPSRQVHVPQGVTIRKVKSMLKLKLYRAHTPHVPCISDSTSNYVVVDDICIHTRPVVCMSRKHACYVL